MSEANASRAARSRLRYLKCLLFAMSLLAFAWFHSGGGWNQNARFALVRAIVEEGRFSIDSFLAYDVATTATGPRLVRLPIRDGELVRPDRRVALYWKDVHGNPVPLARRIGGTVAGVRSKESTLDVAVADGLVVPVRIPPGIVILRNGQPAPLDSLRPGEMVQVELREPDGRRAVAAGVASGHGVVIEDVTWSEPGLVTATGDLSFNAGHFHPAKAPGGSFLAVPAYFVIRAAGRLVGADPDDWWTLTTGAWLTSIFSVGLLSALTVVLLFQSSMRLSGGKALSSALTALAFALGTPFLPYATMLYEHAPVAFLLFASFYLLFRSRRVSADGAASVPDGRATIFIGLAGASVGLAAVANYAMAVVAVLFFAYLVAAVRRASGWLWYAIGLLGPFLLLCAYNVAAFGTPFTTNYAFEDPQFLEQGDALLGVFRAPRVEVIALALFSPFRGLFLAAPALLLGALGLVPWFRSGRMRAEWRLVVSVLTFFLAFLTTFNGWHGGWGVSVRYLVPALPFLALPAVFAFARSVKASSLLAAVSIGLSLLATAVDPQAPAGLAPMATIQGLPGWRHSPILLYEWPLFTEGRATPVLDAQRDEVLRANDEFLLARGAPSEARTRGAAELRRQIDAAVNRGEPAPLLLQRGPGGEPGLSLSPLSTIAGPVSANPVGMYEGWMYRSFPPGSTQARWNSFNTGEFFFPESRWSLLPLLLIEALLGWFAIRLARRLDALDAPPAA